MTPSSRGERDNEEIYWNVNGEVSVLMDGFLGGSGM